MNAPDFKNALYWRLDACLEIVFESKGEFSEKVLEDMLYLFCKQANACFYESENVIMGFASDPRKRWQVNKNIAQGSINNWVAAKIQYFLLKELTPLALQYHNVQQVIITVSQNEYKIDVLKKSSD